ncbi:MAG: hypothetical protein R2909_01905 [Gemmatimonadales bacterium]
MFTTCIYCHKPLGANEVVETFPVGRRLAFDAARGRLWVVCRSCERWNLSPLETRWEAIEDCEQRFADTRLKVSTDNIGLARLPEGLELVRIGAPGRPEFAAWRYGDQFGRRRRRAYLIGGGAAVAVGALVVGASAAGIGIGGLGGVWGNIPQIIQSMRKVRLKTADGRLLKVRGTDFVKARLIGDGAGGPQLSLKLKGRIETFEGAEAIRHAGRLLPAINSSGGSKRNVQDAVSLLDARLGSEAFLESYFRGRLDATGSARPPFRDVAPLTDRKGRPKPVSQLPAPTRLALEMALHEESERRAIEGELEILEEAWREAEVIAAIADNMFVPAEVEAKLAELKGKDADQRSS